jgi:hypothetical protein
MIKSIGFGGVLHEFFYDKKVSVSIDTLSYDIEAEIKVFVNMEPNCVINNSKEVIDNNSKFDLILTFKDEILKNCPNSKKFILGATTFTKSNTDFKLEEFSMDKKNEISYLTSSKKQTEGHIFRHNVLNFLSSKKLDKFNIKTITSPPYIPTKQPIFENAKFSIIIENGKYQNYISEKLIDCLVTKTIPLYWGAPNVSEFFNSKGIITFNTIEELNNILDNLDPNMYEKSVDYIEENYLESKKYLDFHGRLKNEIELLINGQTFF